MSTPDGGLPAPPESPLPVGGATRVRERPDPGSPLGRYEARTRRQRTVYAAVLTVLVVVLGVVVVVAWTHGETNNADLHTAARTPADLPLAAPAATVTARWRTTDRAATGSPQWGGTVVLSGERTVRGVDARTGVTTWSYTRSDRTVCSAAQLAGVTVAVYRLGGNCDEVTALDSSTGARRWTRTLDMDGMPVTGTPRFTTSAEGGTTTLLVWTSSVAYALDPYSGYTRWTYARFGCRIGDIALGSSGALISQTCSSRVQCAEEQFCGKGPQLLLRGPYDARDDKDTKNPDKIVFDLMRTTATPVSADTLVSAVFPDGTLHHLDQRKGTTTARTPLPSGAASRPPVAVGAGRSELVWTAGRLLALDPGTATPRFDVPLAGRPTVVATGPSAVPDLATARITAVTATGVVTVAGRDGRTTPLALSGSAVGADPLAYPLGDGMLVTGGDGTRAFA